VEAHGAGGSLGLTVQKSVVVLLLNGCYSVKQFIYKDRRLVHFEVKLRVAGRVPEQALCFSKSALVVPCPVIRIIGD
jgi:hypothetical protein